ncbi:putative MFS multidrug transporter [Diplocarpon rosae]|nr:putative MFS multidrug transporter [Diplocarpon rosae]
MAVRSQKGTAEHVGENTPLFNEQEGSMYRDDGSSEETLRETQRRADEEEEPGSSDKANQHMGRKGAVLVILNMWGLIFLQASNMSGITTTQSKIAEDLDAFTEASWFVSVYLIAMSSCSPLAAKLAQIFTPRHCVFAAAILFAMGGMLASQATTLSTFLTGRAIQGIGGAGIMAVSFILVLTLTNPKNRGLFVGLINTGFTIGVSCGAVVAGALVPVTGWRFLFWIQSPLAVVFGAGLLFSIPSSFTSGYQEPSGASVPRKLGRIDFLGASILALIAWSPIVASVILLGAFVVIELYVVSEPIIPVAVLKSRGSLLSCISQLGIMAARWTVLFYSPVYAMAVRGWSPASAGSILIPTNVGFAIGGICAGGLHIRRAGSFWLPSVVSCFLFACSLASLSRIANPNTPTALFVLIVFCNGICVGAALNYTLAHLLHLTPPSTHVISTSLLTTFRGFAGSFGSAIGGGLFTRVLKASLERGLAQDGGLRGRTDLVRRLLGSPALVKTLEGAEKAIAIAGYVEGLRKLFVAGTGLALAMVLVQALAGWEGADGEEGGEEEVRQEIDIADEEWEEGREQGA